MSVWAKRKGCHWARKAGFWNKFTTLDHLLTLWALIKESRAHKKKIYCFFVNFQITFNIILRVWLMQHLEALGVLVDMKWRIYALYESMSGKVWSPSVLSEVVTSTIGLSGEVLSPTIAHSLQCLYRWGITLHKEIREFRCMPSRYSYTNITICWWYWADF